MRMLVAQGLDECFQLPVESLGLQFAFDPGSSLSGEAWPVDSVEVRVEIYVFDRLDEVVEHSQLVRGGKPWIGLQAGRRHGESGVGRDGRQSYLGTLRGDVGRVDGSRGRRRC